MVKLQSKTVRLTVLEVDYVSTVQSKIKSKNGLALNDSQVIRMMLELGYRKFNEKEGATNE